MAFFALATKTGSRNNIREIDPLEKAARMIEMVESGVHFDSALDLAETAEASICAEDKESSDSNSEFSNSNASGFLTMLSSLLNKAPQRKASYATGTDHWVPLDPEEIAIMSQEVVNSYKKVHPHVGKDINKNGNFSVVTKIVNNTPPAEKKKKQTEGEKTEDMERMLQELAEGDGSEIEMKNNSSSNCDQEQEQLENDDRPPVHHLIITFWGKDGEKKYFSLYRSRKVTDVISLCERARECTQLFRLQPKGLEKSDYISKLLSCLKTNLLWKSIHVAASLGIVEYFKETSPHKIKSNLYNICPEGYSALHLAVKYNRLEVVKLLVDLGADLNTITTNGDNCMHLAAFASPQMIEFLYDTGKFTSIINAPNGDGSSPLYIAMSNASLYCAKALRDRGASLTADPLDASPRPLIDAIKRGKLDEATLDQILKQSPDSLNQTEPVTGNHALHCAVYKKDLLVLLDQKVCDLNLDMRNSSMQTPLHVYVRKGNLSLIMAICAYKVDINAKNINGNTPLHIATMNLNIEIVRFLLCIGADPNLVNNHRESPRHLAARYKNNETARQIVRSLIICGARTCPANFVGCTVCCVHRDNFIGEQSPQSPSISGKSTASSDLNDESKSEDAKMRDVAVDWNAPTGAYEFELDPDTHKLDEAYKEPNKARSFPQELAIERTMEKLKEFAKERDKQNVISVLSLDGGGIKGLVMTQILLFLQQYLDQPVLDYFDWIAATSTGSLIMSTIFAGHSLRAAQKMYLRFKDMVFDSWTRPYNSIVLEKFFKKAFSESITMSHISYPKVFYTTVRADTFPVQLELIRNYQLPLSAKENDELGFNDPGDVLIWKAARRSCAAPTYFSAAEGKYIDGGMVSNNPTLDLMSEVHFWNSTCDLMKKPEYKVQVGCVVSIGTGITPISPVDPSLFEMNDVMGMLRGLKNLSLVVLDQATATEGVPISRSRSWCHSLGIPYFRLNAPLFKDVLLDCREDSELARMMWDCVVYGHTHRKDFYELAQLLKAIGTTKYRKKRFSTQLVHPSADPSASTHPTSTSPPSSSSSVAAKE